MTDITPAEDARRWLLWAAYSRSIFTLGLAVRKIRKAVNACPTAELPDDVEDLKRQAQKIIEAFRAEGVGT